MKNMIMIMTATAFSMAASTALAGVDGQFDSQTLVQAEKAVQQSWTKASAEDRTRLIQDYSNKICSAYKDKPSAELAKKIVEYNQTLIKYPAEGIKLGDWKVGEKLALSGYGMRVGDMKRDKASKKPNGGNCYACHALSPNEPAAGNLGPKLTGYGARGTSDAMMKYTYGKIYNAHATSACSGMPRFGVNGVLSTQQIADIMAFLMDSDSPVNLK